MVKAFFVHTTWSVSPDKNLQMSIKIAQKWFHQNNEWFDTFKKLPNNVGNLGKIIVATGF